MRLFLLGTISLILLGAATNCAHVSPDKAMAAIEAGDYTSILSGCGSQPIVGFLYCRVKEGDNTSLSFDVIGPPAKCKQDKCVFFKIFNVQGEVAYSGALEKGKTRVTVLWMDLTKEPAFKVGDRGFWTMNHEVHWEDKDGNERVSYSQGEILLRVYKAGYIPLHEAKEDPNYVWTWKDGNRLFRMTTGLRAFTEEAPNG